MTEPTTPVRTPDEPTVYELHQPGSSSAATGVAATCPHCDWSIIEGFPRGTRPGTEKAQAVTDDVAARCAEHREAHQDAYVAGVLRAVIGPLGSSEQAVRQLRVNGLLIVPDPDWKPAVVSEGVPA